LAELLFFQVPKGKQDQNNIGFFRHILLRLKYSKQIIICVLAKHS